MRNKKLAFLACALVAATGLLAAPAAMATNNPPPSSCSSTPTIQVVPDAYGVPTPCRVADPSLPRCAGPNEDAGYTGIHYKNTTATSFNHVATLVTSNNEVFVPSGTQVITGCQGDPVTQLGYRSCHENAVKINGVPASSDFWVVVKGRTTPIQTSMATRCGSTVKCFPILGLGLTASTDQLIQQVETVTSQDGCVLEFFSNSLTGGTAVARLTAESVANGCSSPTLDDDLATILPQDVAALEVKLAGRTLGFGKFGEGYIRSGTNSCTTRIVGGKVYTWGKPCPE
jgi:hypothetical protein